jgi:predicted Rossmann-fold nucleotide-binding protein
LIHTVKLPARPVVCLGKDYWKHLGTFLRETMLNVGTISPEDLELALVTDDTQEAIDYIKKRIANLLPPEIEDADVY